jgi:DnaJ-class molecular chaperone
MTVEIGHLFKIEGDDLFTNVTVTLADALLGFEMTMKHLDGHLVCIYRVKAVTEVKRDIIAMYYRLFGHISFDLKVILSVSTH